MFYGGAMNGLAFGGHWFNDQADRRHLLDKICSYICTAVRLVNVINYFCNWSSGLDSVGVKVRRSPLSYTVAVNTVLPVTVITATITVIETEKP